MLWSWNTPGRGRASLQIPEGSVEGEVGCGCTERRRESGQVRQSTLQSRDLEVGRCGTKRWPAPLDVRGYLRGQGCLVSIGRYLRLALWPWWNPAPSCAWSGNTDETVQGQPCPCLLGVRQPPWDDGGGGRVTRWEDPQVPVWVLPTA